MYNTHITDYYMWKMWIVRGNSTRRIFRDRYYAELRKSHANYYKISAKSEAEITEAQLQNMK